LGGGSSSSSSSGVRGGDRNRNNAATTGGDRGEKKSYYGLADLLRAGAEQKKKAEKRERPSSLWRHFDGAEGVASPTRKRRKKSAFM
jgi:hypothetical protein